MTINPESTQPAAAKPAPTEWSKKGFRGPKYTGFVGVALAASGGLVTIMSFSSLTGMTTIGVAQDVATGGGETIGAFAIAGAFIVSALVAAFGVFLIAWSGLWGSWRLGRGEKSATAARRARTAVTERAPSRTQVQSQYTRTKPKIGAAVNTGRESVKTGRETVRTELAPRAAAGAAQAKDFAAGGASQAKGLAAGALAKARQRRELGQQTVGPEARDDNAEQEPS